jgi:hypothetical protein
MGRKDEYARAQRQVGVPDPPGQRQVGSDDPNHHLAREAHHEKEAAGMDEPPGRGQTIFALRCLDMPLSFRVSYWRSFFTPPDFDGIGSLLGSLGASGIEGLCRSLPGGEFAYTSGQ